MNADSSSDDASLGRDRGTKTQDSFNKIVPEVNDNSSN